MTTDSVMTLSNIHMRFPFGEDWRGRPRGFVHALNGIDLEILRGKTLGVVGESGCGKSTLAQVLMGIRKPSEGEVIRNFGADHDVQIVFQDPQSSLNARMPVWRVITEPVFAVSKRPKAELRALAADLAAKVGLRPEVLDRYPHEFSGGQRQRIAIARALSSDPDVIVLDEPTSALDISIQAQILNLLKDLQAERGLTYIFISHDISVVRYLCDEVAVMYLGQVVEHGASDAVLAGPKHPYTRLLLDSIPTMRATGGLGEALRNTDLPSNRNLPTGCFFKDRCEQAGAGCDVRQNMVPTEQAQVRCCQTTAATPQKVSA
ncbi:oligopeptide/dipeptide ABC transporter ATP-binding protein [uncultured Shimia sp.]|uniref:oligopeptide/dipeptide ABC transporter ATP-binding protein n=1 Tax=uncultured Shimia sp. TaxID=573152 RepID=UPI0026351C47|nr:oligopeptide/dipeptide ABC transporter ATP-binding protein [uncultured Shimia sp.]